LHGDRFGFSGGEEADYAAEVLPCGLIESGIGADEVADHVPCSQVQSAFGGRAHGERHRTLRTETDALRGGFLPRPDADRLRKHIYSDGFMSDFDLAIAAQAVQVFQEISSSRFDGKYWLGGWWGASR